MKPGATDIRADFESRYLKPAPGLALVAGSYIVEGKVDRRTLYERAIGVDMREGPGVDVVANLEKGVPVADIAHVDCVSVLEHSKRPWLVAEKLQACLKPGGTIYVSVPWVWKVHDYPSDYWRFSPECIKFIFGDIDWEVIRYMHTEISDKMPNQMIKGYRWYPRTEVVAFGHKKVT